MLRFLALFLASTAVNVFAADDLLKLHRLAVENDPDYRAAVYGHTAVLEQENQAFGALLPSIGLTTSSTGTKFGQAAPGADPAVTPPVSARLNQKLLELSIIQPLYRPELARAHSQAEWRSLQSKAELDSAAQDLVVRLSERYFGTLRAADDLENARGELEAFGKQLELSKERLEFGLAANTDVDEAQASYDIARARVIEAENSLRSAQDALASITGQRHEQLAQLRDSSPVEKPAPANVEAWSKAALDQNLQLLSARYASNAAGEEIRRAAAGHLPTMDLVARRVRDHANGGASGAQNTDSMNLGIQLSLPIFAGGQTQSRVRELRALHSQTQERQERERRAALRDTRDSFFGVLTNIARVDALRQAVRSAESAVESITLSYELSQRTSFDVLTAQRDLFRARRELVAARYEYILGLLRLKRAAGTLVSSDLERINAWLEAAPVSGGKSSRMAMPSAITSFVMRRPAPLPQTAPALAPSSGLMLKAAPVISGGSLAMPLPPRWPTESSEETRPTAAK